MGVDDVKILGCETREKGKAKWTEYRIQVTAEGKTWNVMHRYSDFRNLHEVLGSSRKEIGVKLPPRRAFGSMSAEVVEKRQQKLEEYLKALILIPDICNTLELQAFLQLPANTNHSSRFTTKSTSGGGAAPTTPTPPMTPNSPSVAARYLFDKSNAADPSQIYQLISKLGEGSYGAVVKATNKENGMIVAIKIIPIDTDEGIDDVLKEVTFMQSLSSEYIVKCFQRYLYEDYLWVVLEYCPARSIADALELLEKPFEEDKIATITL